MDLIIRMLKRILKMLDDIFDAVKGGGDEGDKDITIDDIVKKITDGEHKNLADIQNLPNGLSFPIVQDIHAETDEETGVTAYTLVNNTYNKNWIDFVESIWDKQEYDENFDSWYRHNNMIMTVEAVSESSIACEFYNIMDPGKCIYRYRFLMTVEHDAEIAEHSIIIEDFREDQLASPFQLNIDGASKYRVEFCDIIFGKERLNIERTVRLR